MKSNERLILTPNDGLLNLTPRDATETVDENSSVLVWVLGLTFGLSFLIIISMFSFYCCRKWLPCCSCCCCPSGDDDDTSDTSWWCPKVKRGEERDKLIESGHVRPPNPLIPQKETRKSVKAHSDEEDSDEGKDKVKRRTLPTRPAIKVTTATTPRSRSPSPPHSLGGSSSRASSPRPPAFDIVTDPSNPLLRMK